MSEEEVEESLPITNCTGVDIEIVDNDDKLLAFYPSVGNVRLCSMQQKLRKPLHNDVPVISRPKFVGIDDPAALLVKHKYVLVTTKVAEYLCDSRQLLVTDDEAVTGIYSPDIGEQSMVRAVPGKLTIKRLVEW